MTSCETTDNGSSRITPIRRRSSLLPTPIRILIDNRDYASWTFQDPETNADIPNEGILKNICPADHHLFSKDVFTIDTAPDKQQPKLCHSPVRLAQTHAGVLQLSSNKTYGRTANKKRLLYKCIPDDKHLPIFLVPYEPKIGFSKAQSNKYIIFRFFQWNDKHPHGIIEETLGDVDSLDAFYEYQLYCKSLHASITSMTHDARIALNQKTNDEYVEQILKNPAFRMRDQSDDCVFTIDPKNSLDFDDGFSISQHPTNENERILRVYIANVYVWLETLGLWNSFSQRVSTIYLPDRRRPMLPTVLSDALCSLQEEQPRFAFVMEITVDIGGDIVQEQPPRFYNAYIKVAKNYRYEEPALLADANYIEFTEITKRMDRNVLNSHDVVAFWMVKMNCYCGRTLAIRQQGIFRSAVFTDPGAHADLQSDMTVQLPEETRRVIRMWNNTTGQYLAYSDGLNALEHELMKVKTYIHITSPIRRLVDLLNQMIFCRELVQVVLSPNASTFLDKWLGQLDYINTAMRSIRKVQTDCDLLFRCMNDPNIMSGLHSGVLFDKMLKNDGSISYMVYLEKWKMLSRISVRQDFANYYRADFRVFLFEDEDKAKRKIRLALAELQN